MILSLSNIFLFLLITVILTIPGYIIFHSRRSAFEAISVGYFLSLFFLHGAVVLFCTFLHGPISWGLSIGTLVLIAGLYFNGLKRKDFFSSALNDYRVFLVAFIGLWILFSYPFVQFFPFNELFDFFVYWGYIVKRFLIDNYVHSKATIHDYSAYNYPLLDPIWNVIYRTFINTEMVMRYKNALLFPFLTLMGVGFYKEERTRTIALALFMSLAILVINNACVALSYTSHENWFRYVQNMSWAINDNRGFILLPGYFTALTDLSFALFMVMALIFYLKMIKTERSLTDLSLFWMFSCLVSQLKYDGIIFHLSAIFIGLMAQWSSQKGRRSKIKLFSIAFLFSLLPFIWIAYEKFSLGKPGSFQNFSLEKGFSMFGGVVMRLGGEYPLWLGLAVLTFILATILIIRNRSFLKVLIVIPPLSYLLFLVFILGAEWQEDWFKASDFKRLIPRVLPAFIFVLVYFFYEILPNRKWVTRLIWGVKIGAVALSFLFLFYQGYPCGGHQFWRKWLRHDSGTDYSP